MPSVEAEKLGLVSKLVFTNIKTQLANAVLQETLSAWVMVILVPPQLVELERKTRVPGSLSRSGDSDHGAGVFPSASAAAVVTSLNVEPGG